MKISCEPVYTGTLTGEIEKGNGILTIKNLPASVLTGSDVNKSLTEIGRAHV